MGIIESELANHPPEYYLVNKDCDTPSRWHADNREDGVSGYKWTSEAETNWFLEYLVKLLKPRIVVELGTSNGTGAKVISSGLLEGSILHTCEIDKTTFDLACENLKEYKQVQLWFISAIELAKEFADNSVDLLFVDSGKVSRKLDTLAWISKMSNVGIIIVHDTDTERPFRKEMEEISKEYQLQIFHFPTPRGLTLMRKVTI